MNIHKTFSSRLDILMRDNNIISTAMLSRAINCDSATVSLWRLAKRLPSLQCALDLANYFGCTLDYLFGITSTNVSIASNSAISFYESMVEVLKFYNQSWYYVVKSTKIAKSNLYDWRAGRVPQIPTIIVLANHFGCSMDFLVGRQKTQRCSLFVGEKRN